MRVGRLMPVGFTAPGKEVGNLLMGDGALETVVWTAVNSIPVWHAARHSVYPASVAPL